jgi:hypothetical protein
MPMIRARRTLVSPVAGVAMVLVILGFMLRRLYLIGLLMPQARE